MINKSAQFDKSETYGNQIVEIMQRIKQNFDSQKLKSGSFE